MSQRRRSKCNIFTKREEMDDNAAAQYFSCIMYWWCYACCCQCVVVLWVLFPLVTSERGSGQVCNGSTNRTCRLHFEGLSGGVAAGFLARLVVVQSHFTQTELYACISKVRILSDYINNSFLLLYVNVLSVWPGGSYFVLCSLNRIGSDFFVLFVLVMSSQSLIRTRQAGNETATFTWAKCLQSDHSLD